MNTRAILLATLLLTASFAFIATIPTAKALGTSTGLETEYWQQVSPTGSIITGFIGPSPTYVLTAGTTYYLAAGMGYTGGTANAATVTLTDTANSSTIVRLETSACAGGSKVLARGDVTSFDDLFDTNSTNNIHFAVIRFVAPTSATVSLSGGACTGAPATQGMATLNLPPGITTATGMLAVANVFILNSQPAGILFAQTTTLGENGILSTETTRTPTNTQWTWTQIDSSNAVSYSAATGTTNPSNAQSFSIPSTAGKYLSIMSVRVKASCAPCSGTWSFAVLNSLPAPYDITQELSNATFTYSWSGNGNALLTIDFVNGLVSDDSGGLTTGSPTFTAFGIAATATNRIAGLNQGGTNYVRFYDTVQASSADVDINTGNPYSGGTVWTYSHATNTWTQVSANDWTQVTLTTYGGATTLYSLSETAANTGGATYTYFCEGQIDSNPQRYSFSSSFGGGARLGSFQSGGNGICAGTGFTGSSTIQEWRLGYENIPLDTSQTRTITLNTTGSGRNLLFWGTFAGTQPTHTHIAGPISFTPTSGNAMGTYRILSTDDYFTQVFFKVRQCVTQAENGQCSDVVSGVNTANGAIIPNGSFSGTVASLRAFAGSWNATGDFNLTGQDIGGTQIAMTIQATGYTTDSGVIVTIPSSGTYYANLTLTLAGSATISVTQSGVTCSFDANSPQYNTGQIMSINATRTRVVELWFSLFRIANGGTQQITSMFDWTTSLNNTVLFAYPNGQTLQATDSGQYILAVFTPTSSTTRGNTICYDTIGVNQAGNFPVSSNLVQDLNNVAQTAITAQSTISGQGGTAQLQKTTYDDYLILLDWGFGSIFFGIPNMVVILFVFLGGALLLRFGRGGGNQ